MCMSIWLGYNKRYKIERIIFIDEGNPSEIETFEFILNNI